MENLTDFQAVAVAVVAGLLVAALVISFATLPARRYAVVNGYTGEVVGLFWSLDGAMERAAALNDRGNLTGALAFGVEDLRAER